MKLIRPDLKAATVQAVGVVSQGVSAAASFLGFGGGGGGATGQSELSTFGVPAGASSAGPTAKGKKDTSEAVAEGVKKAQQQAPAVAPAAPTAGAGVVSKRELSSKEQRQLSNNQRILERSGPDSVAGQQAFQRLKERGLEDQLSPDLRPQGVEAPKQKIDVQQQGTFNVILSAPDLASALSQAGDERAAKIVSGALAKLGEKVATDKDPQKLGDLIIQTSVEVQAPNIVNINNPDGKGVRVQ
jgi:hypothetical protein